MDDIFKNRKEIVECIKCKVSQIKVKYLEVIEECEVDYDKATSVAFNYGYWGYLKDPSNPFERLPSVVRSELTDAIKSCVDSHSLKA